MAKSDLAPALSLSAPKRFLSGTGFMSSIPTCYEDGLEFLVSNIQARAASQDTKCTC
jgi:tripartite-type tricarboxylate transporter receptor subunit TctC